MRLWQQLCHECAVLYAMETYISWKIKIVLS